MYIFQIVIGFMVSIIASSALPMEKDASMELVRNTAQLSKFAGCLVAFKPVVYIDDDYLYKLTKNDPLRYGHISSDQSQEWLMPYYTKETQQRLEKAYWLSLLMPKTEYGSVYQPSLPNRLLMRSALQLRLATAQERALIKEKIQKNEARLGLPSTQEESLALLEKTLFQK